MSKTLNYIRPKNLHEPECLLKVHAQQVYGAKILTKMLSFKGRHEITYETWEFRWSSSHQYFTTVQSWNRQFGSQTIHPTQKFSSMNLLQILA